MFGSMSYLAFYKSAPPPLSEQQNVLVLSNFGFLVVRSIDR